MKRSLLFLVAILAVFGVFAADSPKREFRSTWLTTYSRIDWPSSSALGDAEACKEELIEYLDKHANRNYTGVCLHVRCVADAVYKSSYEPWSQYLTGTRGKDPGWDPLAFAVEECHKRGLECYAWVNPFRFNRNNASRTTPQDKAVLAKDGWIVDNGTVDEPDEYKVFNPAKAEVREYLYGIFREIYTNYRIDGMLFDDYFYPNKMPATTEAQDYEDFVEQNPGVSPTETNILNWRRGNINLFMRELYAMIQEDRPDMRFGLSPAGVARNGAADAGIDPPSIGSDWQYDDICSDPVAWLKDGSIDFISPQIYWFAYPTSNSYTRVADYTILCDWWSMAADHFGRHFYSSMAPYRMLDGYNNIDHWKDLSYQITLNRSKSRNNAPGAIMYSAKYMDGPSLTGWGDYLEANSFQSKSLIPLIDWKTRSALTKPTATRSGNTISWQTGLPAETAYDPIRRYTLYAVPTSVALDKAQDATGDGLDVKYLVQVVYDEEFELPQTLRTGYWYAVCAYDGYGYESEPCLVDYPDEIVPVVKPKDDTEYPDNESLSITNVWFNSNLAPFSNLTFAEDGKLNRGMVISGDKVLVTGRTENSGGTCYLDIYDLYTGDLSKKIYLDIPSDVAYPCNDIVKDNNGDLYISNITLNIQNEGSFRLYKVDPTDGAVSLFASLSLSQSGRVDHCGVEALADGTYHIYAAMAKTANIIRWSVAADGTVKNTEICEVDGFVPSSAANFGIAPKAYPMGGGKVVIDGGETAPTEYNFADGSITAQLSTAAMPTGMQANGFAHFGEECTIAYVATDHTSANGYKFYVANGNPHGLSACNVIWTIPEINMGSVYSTTLSAPVDAITVDNGSDKSSYIAIYVPGNSLAVYRMDFKGQTSIDEIEAEETKLIVRYGNAYFSSTVATAEVFDLSGRLIRTASNADFISLPTDAGIYIVRIDGAAHRVVVR